MLGVHHNEGTSTPASMDEHDRMIEHLDTWRIETISDCQSIGAKNVAVMCTSLMLMAKTKNQEIFGVSMRQLHHPPDIIFQGLKSWG